MKVRIKKKGYRRGGGIPAHPQALNAKNFPYYWPGNEWTPQETDVRSSIPHAEPGEGSVEAEGGETVFIPDIGNQQSAHFDVTGPRHSSGGVELNVPKESFFFSDTRDMKIGGPILSTFGKSEDTKKKYTPADLAKQYDVNKFTKQAADPNSTKVQQKTAQMMIENYKKKLAQLALVQESTKGFPSGVPEMAIPYLSSLGVDPGQMSPGQSEPQAQFGGPYIPDPITNLKTISSLMKDGGDYVWANSPTGGGFWQDGGEAYLQGGGKPDQFGDLAAQLQAIKERNKKAQYEANRRLEAEKDQRLKSYISGQASFQSKQINFLKSRIQDKIKKANTLSSGIMQNRIISDIEKDIGLIKEAADKLPYVSNPENYISSPNRPYNFKYKPAKALPPPKPFVADMYQNPDLSWTQGSFPDTITPAPVSIPQDTIDPFQLAQQAMMQSPGAHPYQSSQIPTINQDSIDQAAYKAYVDSVATSKKKQYGGDLPKAQLGNIGGQGKVIPDGKGNMISATTGKIMGPDPNFNATASNTRSSKPIMATPSFSGEIGPYSEMQDVLTQTGATVRPGQILPTGKVALKQHANPKGGYGKNQSDIWQNNWKDVLDQFEQQFGHKYVKKKGANEEARWIQEAMHNSVYTDLIGKKYPPDLARRIAGAVTFNADKDNAINSMDAKHGEWTDRRIRYDFPEYQSPEAPSKAGDIAKGTLNLPPRRSTDAPWWLQDVVGTGKAALDYANLRKHLPWGAKTNPYIPEPTFYDPTRALANNTEQANIATQGANAYGSPQSYGATASKIQGESAKNAANIMGVYDDKNVGIANSFAGMRGQYINQADIYNSTLAGQLYDKNTIANQQFENAKREQGDVLTDYYTNAVTNRADAQRYNQLYPHYGIDTTTGGMGYATNNPFPYITGSSGANATKALADSFIKEYGMKPEDAWDKAIKYHNPVESDEVNPMYRRGQYPGRGRSNSPYDPYSGYGG